MVRLQIMKVNQAYNLLTIAETAAYRPMPMNVDLHSVVVASPDQLASSIGGETVILGLKAGRYYGVDRVGARIWQIVQTPTPVADIRNAIVAEYDVDPRCCEADLLRLLDQMIEARLLEVRTESDS